MKTSKIVIKNLFGIRETTLDGKSVEISGPKGAGKTSVLDAIRFALTNRSERDCIVHQGADEGEIIIETTTGLSIDRKALPAKSAGTVKVRDGSLLQTRPAEFLSQIFTPLQLNPVEFTQLSRQEKNRVILSLIEFDWDVNWIREQFGEIPQGVDYSKHILEVLNDIQAENGVYFQSRQNINRDIRNKQAFISDIAKDIPSGYDYDRWNQYPIGERYRELERLREKNSVIERAKAFRANFTSKLRGLEGSRDVEIGAIDRDIAAERAALTGSIERMKAELQATEEKLAQLSRRRQDRVDIATANFEAAKAKLEKDVGVAEQYADQEPVDTTALAAEVTNAEEMRKHLNEYGFEPNRAGFMRCPFHQGDHTASLKIYAGDRGWHCFGCNSGGSVIDFVMRLYDINFRQAVLRLDLDFGLGLSQAPQRSRAEQSAILEARRREAERRAVFEREYHEKTVEHRYWWEVLKYFAPTKEDAAAGFIHPLYAEALRRQPYLEYWLEENLGKGVIT